MNSRHLIKRAHRATSLGCMALLFVACQAAEPPQPEPSAPTPAVSDASPRVEPEEAEAKPSSEFAIGFGELGREGDLADVVFVRAIQSGETTWRFEVTIQRPGAGQKDRIEAWDVVLPDGTVVLPDPAAEHTMVIDAPASAEPQSFEQDGIEIPIDVRQVRVRALDASGGYGGREIEVYMWASDGAGFEVVQTY